MKKLDPTRLNELLLEDHLGLIDEDDRRMLRQMLQDDPQLAAKHARLQGVLEPLDAWSAAEPPAGFVDRILDEITSQDLAPPTVVKASLKSGLDYSRLGWGGVSLRDLLAVAAVLLFFFTMLAPSMSMVRERSRRVACAGNLGGIGRAVSAYSLANGGALPHSRGVRLTSFLPVSDNIASAASGRPVYSPNRKSLFLLARLRFVPDVGIFLCPSSKQSMPLNEVPEDDQDGYSSGQLCSYDSLNMAGPTPRYSLTTTLPYVADANPLFVGGRFNPRVAIRANSPNHRKGAGQNVLCIDGAVDWRTTPECGHRGDNIWQAGRILIYKGTEVQKTNRDSFLVP